MLDVQDTHITDFAVLWGRRSFGVELGATGCADWMLRRLHSQISLRKILHEGEWNYRRELEARDWDYKTYKVP